MERMWWIPLTLTCCLVACGGPGTEKTDSDWDLNENNQIANNETANNETANNETANNETANNTVVIQPPVTNANNVVSCLASTPERHRSTVSACDDARGPGATVPVDELEFAQCQTDDECTDGANGRCVGNSHDSYYCTYDECFADAECGSGAVCECGGGFRSDHNICLPGNCATDADCGTGYCSPSQGDCGAYFGTVAYFCHTCEDECVNDTDCGNDGDPWGSYCMYDQGVGHWRCSDSQCAG